MRKKRFLSGYRMLGGLILMSAVAAFSVSCKHSEIGGYIEPEKRLNLTFVVNDVETQAGATVTKAHNLDSKGKYVLYYEVGEVESADTKGAMVTTASFHPNIGILGYKYPAEGSINTWDALGKADRRQNLVDPAGKAVVTSTVNGQNVWTIGGAAWPGEDWNVALFSYAPHMSEINNGGTWLVPSDYEYEGAPYLTYTVPSDVTKQKDLVMAHLLDLEGNYNRPAELAYKHVLTAVRFKTGADFFNGKINYVKFKNVKAKGTIYWVDDSSESPATTHEAMTWYLTDDIDTYTLDFGSNNTVAPDSDVNTGDLVFMMLPQSFVGNDDAEIEISYTQTGYTEPQLLSHKLKDTGSWPMGKCINYVIRAGEAAPVEVTLTFDATAAGTINGERTYQVTGMSGDEIPAIPEPVMASNDRMFFDGWDPVLPREYPRVNTTYTAQWVEGDTQYKVEHYYQNIDNDDYTIDANATQTKYGIAGRSTRAQAIPSDGFTCVGTDNSDSSSDIQQVEIAADGKTVVKLYYDRNIIVLTFDLDQGTTTTTLGEGGTLSGRYGAAVSIANPTRENCTFSSWDNTVPPTFTQNATYTAQWEGDTRDRKVDSFETRTEYTFQVTENDDLKVEYSGGDISYSVTSYSTATQYKTTTHNPERYNPATNTWDADGTPTTDDPVVDVDSTPKVTPEPWRVSSNTGSSWLTNLPTTATTPSSSNADARTASASASSYHEEGGGSGTAEMNTYMKTIAPTVDGYDLSKHNIYGNEISQTTANCYIVSAPGTYKFPVVHGNALSGGNNNGAAYASSSFVDYNGAHISSPTSGLSSASSAELIWNDMSSGAISVTSSLTTEGSYKYVTFEITKANIKQGNAVIAVKNGSTILWSWHIWFTVPGPTVSVASGVTGSSQTYNMFPCNLGWCDDNATVAYNAGKKIYDERTANVTFTQVNNSSVSKDIIRTFKQNGHEETSGTGNGVTSVIYSQAGNSTYYQWGRKDPFLGSTGVASTIDKTCYGTKWSYTNNTSVTIAMNITNPTVFYNCSSKPNTSTNNDFWSANNTATWANDSWTDANGGSSDAVVKTVYDPCPVGFAVAPANAFTVFTDTGKNSGTPNVDGSFANGYVFYSGKSRTGTKMFFPTMGLRDCGTGTSYRGKIGSATSGYYWSAVPCNTSSGRYLYFSSSYVNPLYGADRAYGFPVRPVAN